VNKNVPASKTSYAEKQDLITKLGIKVYPSDDGKVWAYCLQCTSLHRHLQTFPSDNQHRVADTDYSP
jgi:hypothetical protein